VDETAWVAIAGILGTLLSPMVGERMRRRSELQMRLHDERVSTYGELLAAVSRLTENAVTRASLPLADNLSEPDDDAFRRLVGRVTVVAGKDVRRKIDQLSELFARHYAALYLAQAHHRYLDREEKLDDEKAIEQRMALGGIADELRTVRDDLERAIRKDIGA
jgi:hypothetical protein